MISAAVLMACPHLAVPARLMYHVAMVESNANQYAIGVVGGRLLRQPASLDEAIATARSLEAQGYNFSVGVAQVNHANLKKYGLDTYEKAFSICDNLLAGSRILAQCYSDAGGVWGKAFSCYYSGDFTTGYRDGYVQRLLASLGSEETGEQASAASDGAPIPVILRAVTATSHGRGHGMTPGTAAYRVGVRTTVMDTVANAVVARAVPDLSRTDSEDALSAGTRAGTAIAPLSRDLEVTKATVPLVGSRAGSTVHGFTDGHIEPGAAQASVAMVPKVFVPRIVDLKRPAPRESVEGQPSAMPVPLAATSPGNSPDAAFVF